MASFLGRHGKKQRVLPALCIVHAARASQSPVNLRREVMVGVDLPRIHGAIMPSRIIAGKGLCGSGSLESFGQTSDPFPIVRDGPVSWPLSALVDGDALPTQGQYDRALVSLGADAPSSPVRTAGDAALMNEGRYNGKQPLPAEILASTLEPAIALPNVEGETRGFWEILNAAYGMGRETASYRGHLLAFHGGALGGFFLRCPSCRRSTSG